MFIVTEYAALKANLFRVFCRSEHLRPRDLHRIVQFTIMYSQYHGIWQNILCPQYNGIWQNIIYSKYCGL